MESAFQVQILDEAVCISLLTNALRDTKFSENEIQVDQPIQARRTDQV